jgi:hypothetical protein
MNKYRHHLIVPEADLALAKQLAMQLAGGTPDTWFLLRLQDSQGQTFYATNLPTSEPLRQAMAGAAAALPSLRWFRVDICTNELQESTELVEVEAGQEWTFDDSLAVCDLEIIEEEI